MSPQAPCGPEEAREGEQVCSTLVLSFLDSADYSSGDTACLVTRLHRNIKYLGSFYSFLTDAIVRGDVPF